MKGTLYFVPVTKDPRRVQKILSLRKQAGINPHRNIKIGKYGNYENSNLFVSLPTKLSFRLKDFNIKHSVLGGVSDHMLPCWWRRDPGVFLTFHLSVQILSSCMSRLCA